MCIRDRGYQISQYDKPFSEHGEVEILTSERDEGWSLMNRPRRCPERQAKGGRRCFHGLACSNAAAARSTVVSSPRLPISCNPTGNPRSIPHGRLIAGWPTMLIGNVHG